MGFVSCKRYLKIAIVVLVFAFVWLSMLLQKKYIVDRSTLSDGSGHSDGNYISFRNSKEFAIVSTTEAELKITAKCGKFVLAFSFGDQLTWATESLLALAAVASYGGRDVVVPFVKHSRLYGTKIDDNTGTLSRYFDLEKLNRKLESYNFGSLVSWERFQKHCQYKLDVLMIFLYSPPTDHRAGRISYSQKQLLKTNGWTPCPIKHHRAIERFEIRRVICIDPEVFTSLQRLDSEILHNAPCVGISQWRGIGFERTHFSLPSSIPSPRSVRHKVPISPVLLQIAREFVSNHLGNNFISVHIRSEWILRDNNANSSCLIECAQQLKAKFQVAKSETGANKVFLATDFTKFGSSSYGVKPAQERSKELQEVLYKILENPKTFDPEATGLSDRGSIAIVEMRILTFGKTLFLLGGGKFEKWMESMFQHRNNNTAVEICYHNSARR